VLDIFSLKGKVALVTGSSRGLGWAMAQALSGAGAHVVLNGRDRVALDARAAELETAAGVAEIEQRLGRLDIVICNAGIVIRKPSLDTTDQEWTTVLDTDLTTCFRVAREAARVMVKHSWGRIIMISSVMGSIARPTIASYVASKAGLHGLTRALAVEFGPLGINVNCIGPGFYPSEANEVVRNDKSFYDWVSARSPLNRWGDPKELGGAAIYFASEASSFCNGQVLTIDGGMTVAL
jgi:gluconate 5-dehydrogenase